MWKAILKIAQMIQITQKFIMASPAGLRLSAAIVAKKHRRPSRQRPTYCESNFVPMLSMLGVGFTRFILYKVRRKQVSVLAKR